MLSFLFGMAVLMVAVVVIPLLLLKLAFGLVTTVLFLPFKILGVLFRIGFGLLAVVLKVLFTGVGLVLALVGILLGVVLLPLLPLILLGGLLWLVIRAFSSPAPRLA
jgi:hypothetical protein